MISFLCVPQYHHPSLQSDLFPFESFLLTKKRETLIGGEKEARNTQRVPVSLSSLFDKDALVVVLERKKRRKQHHRRRLCCSPFDGREGLFLRLFEESSSKVDSKDFEDHRDDDAF